MELQKYRRLRLLPISTAVLSAPVSLLRQMDQTKLSKAGAPSIQTTRRKTNKAIMLQTSAASSPSSDSFARMPSACPLSGVDALPVDSIGSCSFNALERGRVYGSRGGGPVRATAHVQAGITIKNVFALRNTPTGGYSLTSDLQPMLVVIEHHLLKLPPCTQHASRSKKVCSRSSGPPVSPFRSPCFARATLVRYIPPNPPSAKSTPTNNESFVARANSVIVVPYKAKAPGKAPREIATASWRLDAVMRRHTGGRVASVTLVKNHKRPR